MLNPNASREKNVIEAQIKHKADNYKKSETILFIKKDPYKAFKKAKRALK